jgi:hypothetical protein
MSQVHRQMVVFRKAHNDSLLISDTSKNEELFDDVELTMDTESSSESLKLDSSSDSYSSESESDCSPKVEEFRGLLEK